MGLYDKQRWNGRLVTAMLSAQALLSGCDAAIFDRPCPRVTELPVELQKQAAVELATAPALTRTVDAMAADHAFNRTICH